MVINNNNNNKKKKRTWKIVDFAVHADHCIKLKECEKRVKYRDFAWELKKLWNMKATIIPIVIGAFGTVTKGLLNGLEDLKVGGRVETIQTIALLRMARILRRVLETWGDLLIEKGMKSHIPPAKLCNYCCLTRTALALNNQRRLIYH